MNNLWFSPWMPDEAEYFPGPDPYKSVGNTWKRDALGTDDDGEGWMVSVYYHDCWWANDGDGPFSSKEEAMAFVDKRLLSSGVRFLTQEEWDSLVVLA